MERERVRGAIITLCCRCMAPRLSGLKRACSFAIFIIFLVISLVPLISVLGYVGARDVLDLNHVIKRLHIDHEPVLHVAALHTFKGNLDLIDGDGFDVRLNSMFGAEI